MSWIAVGVGVATTAASMEGQAQKESATKKLAASTSQYSPWTGMKPNAIQYANPAGSIGSGVATTMGLHQGLSGGSPSGPTGAQQADALSSVTPSDVQGGQQWTGMDARLNQMPQQQQMSYWQQMMGQNPNSTMVG